MLTEWDEMATRPGTYNIKYADEEVEFNREHSGPHSEFEKHNDEDLETMIIVICAFILAGFAIFILSFCCCCACVFVSYSKLYNNLREVDMIKSLTSAPQN